VLLAPVVRYRLSAWSYAVPDPEEEMFAQAVDDFGTESDPPMIRCFSRTLMGTDLPGRLRELATQLPDIFAPLRSALSQQIAGPPGLTDLMTLPEIDQPPVILEWIPRLRTSHEAVAHLVDGYRRARGPTAVLADAIATMPFANGLLPDVARLLHDKAAAAIRAELDLTLPHLHVHSAGKGDADFELLDTRTTPATCVGRTLDRFHALEGFSSGERRWVDEALAAGTRAMDTWRESVEFRAIFIPHVHRDALLEALVPVFDTVETLALRDGYLSQEAFDLALEGITPALRRESDQAARLDRGESDAGELHPGVMAAMREDLYGREARPAIRILDEPEAHLHPSAQRRIAEALTGLKSRGQNIVLASHSPHFLDLPGWSLVHAQRTSEGVTFSRLQLGDLHARRALAGQMGLTRGELLTRVNLLLVVEGQHDQRLLEAFFADDLEEGGVAILSMHGTNNLLATAQMSFVERFMDVPMAVLLDHTDVERLERGLPDSDLSGEERALRALDRACRRRGATMLSFGLQRPDILAYLHEKAIRTQYPDFAGWKIVLTQFRSRRVRPSFKPWLRDEFGVDLTTRPQIEQVLGIMAEQSLPPHGELSARVKGIVASAHASRWPSPP
jgi:hypothetical protein